MRIELDEAIAWRNISLFIPNNLDALNDWPQPKCREHIA